MKPGFDADGLGTTVGDSYTKSCAVIRKTGQSGREIGIGLAGNGIVVNPPLVEVWAGACDGYGKRRRTVLGSEDGFGLLHDRNGDAIRSPCGP